MPATLAAEISLLDTVVIIVYLLAVGYLGWLGYRRTKTAADYLVAGRKTHPYVMAMSYGATFISTSAIVGFGGVAGLFGMSLLWLTFLNIFAGIFIAFVFFGGPTRRLGHVLDAHTFPELLGRRYQSKFIQVAAGLIIFLFIPLYAAAVLKGGVELIRSQFGIDYRVAVFIFGVVVTAYVVVGGLKGVMYTDALQGSIMFIGMALLLVMSYVAVGGIVQGHQALTDLANLVPPNLAAMGHRGWSAMPEFGWGDDKYNLWWIVISTIVMGVGIGVLAQPQLAVRFMTVKSNRELNRAVLIGGIFILVMTGVAFTVGSLSNVYFTRHGRVFEGRVTKMVDAEKGHAFIQLMNKSETGEWSDVEGKVVPVVLDPQEPYLKGPVTVAGQEVRMSRGRSIAVVNAGGDPEQIIPTYIKNAMPPWYGIVFLLAMLAAAMSTLSSQFHVVGTSIGRDVYEQCSAHPEHITQRRSILVVRVGICIGVLIALILCWYAPAGYFIARATAIFFGLCASAFLPAFAGGLFSKRMTRAAAISSMVVGFAVTSFWLVFVKAKEAGSIGLVQLVTGGKTSILAGHPNWPEMDPLFVGLPLSILTAVVVCLLTRPPDEAHLAKCFPARAK